MRVLKKFGKKALVSALSLALLANTMNSSAFTVQAQEQGALNVVDILEESMELPEMETSAMPIGWFGLSGGSVDLKSGNYENWIDRLDLSETPFVKELYEKLVEASDNDGVDDWLIEDTYFNQAEYLIPVVEVTGTLESLDNTEAQDVMSDILNRYSVFVYAAMNAFDRDHPEVFWLSGSSKVNISMSRSSTAEGYKYTANLYFVVKKSDFDVRATEYRSQASIEAAIEAKDAKVAEFMSAVSGMSDYEKVVYFNEKLTKSNQYNTSADLNNIGHDCRECVSALNGSTGTEGPVCEGYARAFKVLCDEAGIPCVLVDGYARNSVSSAGEGHMWNNTEMDDNWYAVDVTWNDPTGGASGAVSGFEGDKWLLVGSETVIKDMTFEESHPVENRVSSTGVCFTNGPVLSTVKYEVPVATATPAPTATPVPTEAPTATPVPTEAPTATPVPTEAPTATPVPTEAPTATPVPTVAPTATPVPTEAPTATPVPTEAPTATPVPTVAPTATPSAPTQKPAGNQPVATEDGKSGWQAINQKTLAQKDGGRVEVYTNGSNTVPGTVIQSIKGKDVDVFLNLGNGISWTINGKNVNNERINDINFNVILENSTCQLNNIPEKLIQEVAAGRKTVDMSIAHDGAFGFVGTLHINLGTENIGKYANLYYYNETTGKLEFECASKIGDKGITNLSLSHASEYTIVLSDTPMKEVEVTIASPKTGDDWNVTGILMMGMLIMVVGMFGVVTLRKKNK